MVTLITQRSEVQILSPQPSPPTILIIIQDTQNQGLDRAPDRLFRGPLEADRSVQIGPIVLVLKKTADDRMKFLFSAQ